ncbi:MAG: TIGR03905 family TSCPD domain-containing protein [Rikenellaceae bacterium]|nr:TIGR03905 family TSCPD domain-containing protein [Rikenellaceae bacterium]
MHKTYLPQGVCSRQIDIEYNSDGIITEVRFTGGCNGNTQGIERLLKGMELRTAAATLRGIDCKGKGTSCPDQLARALEEITDTL